jgi:P-type Ca2+ transporter type 2C
MSAPSAISGGSHLAVHPSSPTSKSLDGDTLRSRSGSFQSASDYTHRTRANSTNTAVSSSSFDDVSLEEALRPDKGDEKDFDVENNPFAFTPGQLNKLQNPKSLAALWALGGLRGLEKGLRTNLHAGLSVDETHLDGNVSFQEATEPLNEKDFDIGPPPRNDGQVTDREVKGQYEDRLRIFRDNRLPEKKADSIWILIWTVYNDKILILLTVAAVISLALGLYETFRGGSKVGSKVDWVEGVAICVAILIVVSVGAANDWQKVRQFTKLNKRKDDRDVKAIRSGKSLQISVHDITVGDILHLEPGDAIPADGIFISGHGVKCDESSATGESDQMKKTSALEVHQQMLDGTASRKLDPFIISGSKVLEGVGTYLVTSVGQNSSYGKILMSLQTDTEKTPLQVKLGRLANWIGGLGSSAALVLLVVLTVKFLADLGSNDNSPAEKGQQFLDILIVAVTIIVVAVPEGLPLAVTLALAFATTRMLKENNLVRVLRACETMGNATTICSDKTGTLTQNKMTVVAGAWGIDGKFVQSVHSPQTHKEASTFAIVFGKISSQARTLFRQSITLNSTAFEGEENGVPTFIGSKTETALLVLATNHLGLENLSEDRANAEIVQLIPFDSSRKCMGAVVRLSNGTCRLLVKGAAEIMLAHATEAITGIYDEELATTKMSSASREQISALIDEYAQHSLRTIGMLYKDFEQWPPLDARRLDEDKNMADFDDTFHDMVWLGAVGIHDPLRDGVVEAVAQCQQSGVVVRMVTGDNMTTARAIATDCGIISDGAVVMEGPKFRQLSDAEMDDILPKLRVLARSSPEDKRILVHRLKHLGETVAVTGDGTNDGPALKMADVGFSMGIAGTEVAKEASSIVLLDDNFSSTITALMWGRAVNDAVQKFLQFQITVNITAVILTFVSAVYNREYHSVLTAVQLLWVNLIMDTLAALALATDAPTKKILDRPPQPKSAPLITVNMWKMITGQAVYQLIVTFVLYFAGYEILGYAENELATIVFNTFVWMQVFNQFNSRRLDNKFNIFEGIHRNFWFIGINCIMVAGQVMIIFVGGRAFSVERIDGVQWAICLLCALPCLLWAVLIRLFPDEWFGVVFNGAVSGTASVLRPITKGLHFVFHPVAKGWRAMMRPTKRASARMTSKFRKPNPEGDRKGKSTVDEESQISSPVDEKSPTPAAPPTNLPPITLTAPT